MTEHGTPPSPDDEHDRHWNRRVHRSPLPFYVLLAIVCMMIAYLLSHMSR